MERVDVLSHKSLDLGQSRYISITFCLCKDKMLCSFCTLLTITLLTTAYIRNIEIDRRNTSSASVLWQGPHTMYTLQAPPPNSFSSDAASSFILERFKENDNDLADAEPVGLIPQN